MSGFKKSSDYGCEDGGKINESKGDVGPTRWVFTPPFNESWSLHKKSNQLSHALHLIVRRFSHYSKFSNVDSGYISKAGHISTKAPLPIAGKHPRDSNDCWFQLLVLTQTPVALLAKESWFESLILLRRVSIVQQKFKASFHVQRKNHAYAKLDRLFYSWALSKNKQVN
jgi:hypothetical protein